MDEFSYLSVLLSVILGLAVTQILKGFRGLLLSRAHSALLAGDCVGDLWKCEPGTTGPFSNSRWCFSM